MKIVPVILSALFLATIWLASSSANRLPRQLRVPLPLPSSSTVGDRRKSGLFPKMNTRFVVTERAQKMAANKMAPMKRTNALLPNLNLKNKIMGDRNTKRMTSGAPGIAIRPVVIRRTNLTKPSVAVPTTTRAPAVTTKRPLARLPTYPNIETKVTKEAPVLSTKRPLTRPSAQIISDGKSKNVTDKQFKRPLAKPYAHENKTLEGAPLTPVKPLRHYPHQNSSNKDKHGDGLNPAHKPHLAPHSSQAVSDVTMKANNNATEPVVTTKLPPVTPATRVYDDSNLDKNSAKGEVLDMTTKQSSTKLDANGDKQMEESPSVRVKRLLADTAFTSNTLDSDNKRQLSSSKPDMPSGLSYRDWLFFNW